MNKEFRRIVEGLDAKYQELMAMTPVVAEEVPSETPEGGIYLFSENGPTLYVGRTKGKIGRRIKYHFGTADDCPFAWRLAREVTGKKASYRKKGSRKALLEDRGFRRVYEGAKKRIRKMHVRYVGESDSWKQALLEVYVSFVEKSKYNDFDTH